MVLVGVKRKAFRVCVDRLDMCQIPRVHHHCHQRLGKTMPLLIQVFPCLLPISNACPPTDVSLKTARTCQLERMDTGASHSSCVSRLAKQSLNNPSSVCPRKYSIWWLQSAGTKDNYFERAQNIPSCLIN